MRLNEPEMVAALTGQAPEWEGRLTHKPPGRAGGFRSNSEYKDRWFRLKSNFLFYWRIGSGSLGGRPPPGAEPAGVLLLERCHVQREGFAESVHAFSLVFADDQRKHMFLGQTQRGVDQWVEALQSTSYEALRERLINLQIRLIHRTGSDPLASTGFENNPVYAPDLRTPRDDLLFAGSQQRDPPKPKPRKPKSTFQSHLTESWESHSPVVDRGAAAEGPEAAASMGKKKPSFHSHLNES